MQEEKIRTLLQQHVPSAAVEYCFALWAEFPFQLALTKSRITKIGDFTIRKNRPARISINKDLHPCLFLVTYIHEVAHWHIFKTYQHRVDAHGDEWKGRFQKLLAPVMNEHTFPPELLKGLEKHMGNPKASTFSDSSLTQLFRSIDENISQVTLLSQIQIGEVFSLNGRWFQKGQLRRTRVLCKELKSRKNYLVPADMPVGDVQLSIF